MIRELLPDCIPALKTTYGTYVVQATSRAPLQQKGAGRCPFDTKKDKPVALENPEEQSSIYNTYTFLRSSVLKTEAHTTSSYNLN